MTDRIEIDTERLILRRQELTDYQNLYRYHRRNYERFNKFIQYKESKPPSLKDVREMVKSEDNMMLKGRAFKVIGTLKNDLGESNEHWAECFPEIGTGEAVCEFLFYNIILGSSQSSHIYFSVDQSVEGSGIAIEMCKKMIGFGFDVLNLHRIEANIDPVNMRSTKLINSLSFTYEGIARELIKINNKWVDLERYSLLVSDN